MDDIILEAKLDDNISRVTQTLRTIKGVISEGLFRISDEGMHMQAADPAMVGLMITDFKYTVFDSYDYKGEDEDELVGINMEHLYSKVKKANKSDTVTILYGRNKTERPEEGEEWGSYHWRVKVETEHFTSNTRMPTLNLSEDDIPTVDDLEYKNEFYLKRMPFKRCLKFLDDGDSVTFRVEKSGDEGKFKMHQETDHDEVDLAIDVERFAAYEEPTKSMYSMTYLTNVFEGNRLLTAAEDADVLFKLNTDFPLSVSFEDGELALEFVVAPRIEEE